VWSHTITKASISLSHVTTNTRVKRRCRHRFLRFLFILCIAILLTGYKRLQQAYWSSFFTALMIVTVLTERLRNVSYFLCFGWYFIKGHFAYWHRFGRLPVNTFLFPCFCCFKYKGYKLYSFLKYAQEHHNSAKSAIFFSADLLSLLSKRKVPVIEVLREESQPHSMHFISILLACQTGYRKVKLKDSLRNKHNIIKLLFLTPRF